jgi:hypothetical protein
LQHSDEPVRIISSRWYADQLVRLVAHDRVRASHSAHSAAARDDAQCTASMRLALSASSAGYCTASAPLVYSVAVLRSPSTPCTHVRRDGARPRATTYQRAAKEQMCIFTSYDTTIDQTSTPHVF